MLRLLGASLLIGALCVFAGGRPASTSADPAITGYPDSMVVLGDSISRAFNANGSFGEQLPNVWATGTSPSVNSLYSRILAVHPAISGNNFNYAVSGAVMGGLNGQASNAIPQGPELVLILLGANDVCTGSEASMTDPSVFQAQLTLGLNNLTTNLPDTRIGLFSIPDVYNLWDILHNNVNAQNVWAFASICQSLLANPTSMAPADVTRRANVRQRNIDLNTVIANVCAQYVHCHDDDNLGFETVFTPSHVSTLDYFHPSVAGEALIAQLAWDNGIMVTDTNLPVSGSSAALSGNGVNVTLTATDDVGVNGIEYKINAGAWQKYNAPFFVTSLVTGGNTITWRAVDVNGNTEATHTCSVRFWSWPSGDTDCDGFPDSVAAAGKAPEPAIGTDPAVGCAATPALNDEGGLDAMPMDFNDDQIISGQDTGKYGGPTGAFNHTVAQGPFGGLPGERFDLNADGLINGADTGKFQLYFNRKCV